MNSSEKEKAIFRDLFIKSIDGQITQDEIIQFNLLLSTYPDIEDYYVKCVHMQVALREIRSFNGFILEDQADCKDQALWKALADAEKEAPAVEINVLREPKVLIQKVQHQKIDRKISKTSLFSLFTAAAAIILIFVFAYFSPPATGIKVAVLSDSIHAKWADADGDMVKGASIFTSRQNLFLQEGYAELLFDNKARITLEGPAEFQILTNDQIRLQCGRLYATVPQEAIGFTVTTQMAKVIDLGTEFGVESDSLGDTYLHVIKGKTTLIAGQNSNKASMEVGKGSAKKVSAQTSAILDIPCNANLFVRKINSKNDMIWRGQKQIHLADIVGGGNGLGTGKLDMGIDPITGKPTSQTWESGTRRSPNDYRLIPSKPYIDGVFIPNGQTPQVVSSQGHLFRQCPVTDGLCRQNIKAFTNFDYLVLENIRDHRTSSPYLYLHANMGITFNLDAMRRSLPGVHIDRFQSKCGIRKYADHPSASNADFWVLVDGKIRYEKKQVKTDGLYPVDIELSENDHFLTLVETDGGDPEGRILDGLVLSAIESDWGVFADPVLVLK